MTLGRIGAVGALCLALFALSCDRDRSNPLDPQSDLVEDLPSTPAQIGAEAGVGVIRLAWQPVSDSDLAGYAIYRAQQSNGTYTFIAGDGDSTAQITTGKTTFADTVGVASTFFYRVAAVDTTGLRGQLSAFAGATALEDAVAPGPPQSLSAVPDEVTVGRVTLRWSAPQRDSNGGEISGLAGYVILRAEAGAGGLAPIDTVGVDSREYVDSGLKSLTSYSYSVLAFDEVGNASGAATLVQVRTAGLPTPAGLSSRDEIGRVTLTWQAVDDASLIGYDVYRSDRSDTGYVRLTGTEGSAFTTGRTVYTDSSLSGGQLRFYRVQAVGTQGRTSELTAFVSGQANVDETPPGAPRSLSAVADEVESRITLRWGAPQADVGGGDLTGLSGFVLLRAEGGSGSLLPVDTLAADVRDYVDTDLKALTVYTYALLAFDGADNQGPQATTGPTATAGVQRPVNVQAVSGIGRITLTWTPVDDSDLAGYDVYRATRADGDYTRLTGTEGSAQTTGLTTYIDSNLTGGSLFFYKVQAVNANGMRSQMSVFAGAETTQDELPVPASLVATDDVGRIRLSWQSVDDSDLAGYDVLRAATSDGQYVALAGDGNGFTTGRTSFVDSNLTGGALLFYKVRAVARNGLRSELSAFASGEVQADESAPGRPRSVSAVAAEDDAGRITIGWNAPATDASGDALTGLEGYVLLRAEGADGAFLFVDSLATDVREYVDTGLRALTQYRYALFAYDAAGNEGAQTLSNLTRTSGLPTPVALQAADGIERITLSWSAVDAEVLAGYDLFRAATSDGTFQRLAGSEGTSFTTGRTTYIDSGLTAGSLYYYKVQAIGDNGLTSSLSGFASGQAQADESAPGRPLNVSALASQTDASAITVRWTAPATDANGGGLSGLAGFRVLRAEAGGSQETVATMSAGDRQFDDTGLRSLTEYVYAIIAFDAAGNESLQSSQATTTTVGVIAPTGLAASEGIERVTLSWRDVNEADLIGYNVYRSSRPDTGFVKLSGDGGTSYTTGRTTFVDSTIAAGALLYYRVSTVTDVLESDRSGFVSAIAVADTIAAPEAIAASGGITRITVSWSGADDDDLLGYNVYRSTQSSGSYARMTGIEGTTFTTGQTSFIDSGLVGGQIFFYRISVVTGAGESVLSEFSGATVQSDTRPPSAPTFLEGEPVTDDPEKLTLSWTPPSTDSNGGELTGVAQYKVYRSDSATGSFAEVGTSTTAQFQDSGLEAKTTYYYQVEALDEEGNVGPRSSTVAVATAGVDVPDNVRIVSTTPSNGTEPPVVTISWESSVGAIVRYEVERTQVANSTTDSDYTQILPSSLQTTRTDNTVTRGQTYYYRVRAIDIDSRQSDWTEPLRIDVSN